MVDPGIVNSVRNYLQDLIRLGINARFGVIFGSQVNGRADFRSDIDVVVVSPAFDAPATRDSINQLWRAAARRDSRIEPIPCGDKQWQEDTGIPIIETARQEGVVVFPETA